MLLMLPLAVIVPLLPNFRPWGRRLLLGGLRPEALRERDAGGRFGRAGACFVFFGGGEEAKDEEVERTEKRERRFGSSLTIDFALWPQQEERVATVPGLDAVAAP